MPEKRSVIAHGYWKDTAEKFDYYVTALTGALCAYVGQTFQPERLSWSANTLELVALLILVFSVFAGFRKIETLIVFHRLNHQHLYNGEIIGALLIGIRESQTGTVINEDSGEVWTAQSANEKISDLQRQMPAIQKQKREVQKNGNIWYKLRNRTLFAGFILLVVSRVLMAY